ncbi:hypothetical protein AWU66_04900 [Leptospira interrogans serovar Pomona]|nr:hypothetical protein IQ65_13840 [Leptospira interrogans serovar Lai]KYZ61297.1 hypothetical protein AWU66_04900 [Leptospira interrogans serovar Pomona]OMH62659.1 hypothetical protein BW243_17165 [Leptospira interrogans serovar Pomona]OQN91912.1 hypothetical protein AR690_16840 [Leptospira interrogans serovar Lai]
MILLKKTISEKRNKFFPQFFNQVEFPTRGRENNTILSLFQILKYWISYKKAGDFKLDIIF